MPHFMLQCLRALLLASCTISIGLADQLIIEPDMGRAPIIKLLDSAQQNIDLVMYGFTDETLLSTLLKKKQQEINIKVILEDRPYKNESENEKAITAFKKAKLAWQGDIKPYRLIHQKTLLVDNKKALVMTFNFTKSSFKNQRNFGLIIDDPARVQAINQLFSADWNHQSTKINHPSVIISPDNSRDKLIELIQQAKKTIQIYAQSASDFKILGALADAAKRGVKIELLTSNQLREKQASYTHTAGIQMRYSKKLYIHAKVFIFDHKKAVLGSINLTRASLEDNRELALVTEDTEIIKQLDQTFTQDWNNTENSPLRKSKHESPALTEKNIKQAVKLMKHILKALN